MNGFAHLFSGGLLAPLVVNVLLQVTLVTAAALLLARTLLRQRPALRHGMLHCVFVYLLFCPMLIWIMARASKPLVSLALTPETSLVAMPVPAPPVFDASAPTPPPAVSAEPLPIQRVAVSAEAPTPPGSPIGIPDVSPRAETESSVAVSPAAWGGALTPDPAAIPQTGSDLDGAAGQPHAMAGLLATVWGFGVAVALLRFAVGRYQVSRLRYGLCELDARALGGILMEVRMALNARQLPTIVTASDISGPIVVGVRRPIVILPEGLTQRLTAGELRDVLIHECAHVLLCHPLEGLLQRIVSILFWPHPLVHLLGSELAQAREEVCDNFVLGRTAATDYARTLLTMAEGAYGRHPAASLTLLPLRFCLEQRIAGLLDPSRDHETRAPRWQLGATLAACLLLGTAVGVQGAPAQGTPPPSVASPVPVAPPSPVVPPATPSAIPPPQAPVPAQDPAAVSAPRSPVPAQAPTALPPAPAADPTLPTPGKPAAPKSSTPVPQAPATNPTLPAPQPPTTTPTPAAPSGTPATSPTLPAPQAPTTASAPAIQGNPQPPRAEPATPAAAQIDERLVTLKMSKTTLGAALAALMERAHVSYTLDSRLSDDRIGAIRLERIPFRVALETVLRADVHPATYEIENGIYRIIPKERTQTRPEASALPAESRSSQAIVPNRVYVFGSIWYPGYYLLGVNGYTDRIADVLTECGGPLPGADLRHVTVDHIKEGQTQAVVQKVNLLDFLKAGKMEANPVLSPGDVIYIPAKKPVSEINSMQNTPTPTVSTISVDFDNADLYTALKLMFKRAGVQYTVDPGLSTLHVTPNQGGFVTHLTVTAHFTNTPLRNALETVLRNSGGPITYQITDGVYNIIPKAEPTAATAPEDGGPIIELNVDHVDLNSVLKSLAKQGHITIIADPDLSSLTISAKLRQPLHQAVETLLGPLRSSGVTYTWKQGLLQIVKARDAGQTSTPPHP